MDRSGWIALAMAGLLGCSEKPAPLEVSAAEDAGARADKALVESGEAPASAEAGPRYGEGAHSSEGHGWLVEITRQAGIDFVHRAGATGNLHMPEIMGGGVAFLDWNGDGRDDLYLVDGGASSAELDERGAAQNRLYENRGGTRFREVEGAGGAPGRSYGMGVAVGDVDGDGHVDLYLTNCGRDELHLNRSKSFRPGKGDVALGWSTSASFLDHDRDGDLDLFVARYVAFDPRKKCYEEADRREYCGPLEFPALSDVLLANDGSGVFTDVSSEAGIDRLSAAGLGVACEDFDDDGWHDVYVANDGYENHLWVNQGDGTFSEDGLLRGAAFNMHGQAEAGMGVVASDLDEDGAVDLFMTHLDQESNTFYRNLGGTRGFADRTGKTGLAQSSLSSTGFGVVAFDLELDGDQDLFIANGRVRKGDIHAAARVGGPWDRYAEPNLLYLNDGTGVFSLAVELAPRACGEVEVSRGAATGDVDGDGDLDLAIANVNGPARLYRNDAPRAGEPLVVSVLEGEGGNRPAIGAVVEIVIGDCVRRRSVSRGFGYLASSRPQIHLGIPLDIAESEERGTARVRWADGEKEGFTLDRVSGEVRLVRGEGEDLP